MTILRNIVSKPILGILLNDSFREAGSSEINGKLVEWNKAYILTVLEYGNKRGEVRKYTVQPDLEDSISRQLANVGWGTLVEIHLDNNRVVDVHIKLDWSNEAPIE